jgi:hypothetical protein
MHIRNSIFLLLLLAVPAFSQFVSDINRDSARSDRFTGGRIEKTSVVPGAGGLKITINVPAFQMTLWQDGKEVRSYPIGVGMTEWPIYIGRREASSIEWNPVWIPPSSEWIEASTKVKAGEVILPTDPRNPLGKVKIPLGYGYLIHQAKGPADLGSLVSHGCVRVLQPDLYDLAEKIVAARALDVAPEKIAAAKRSKETLVAPLQPSIPVEITYDTIVVEGGRLHIYPDVYGYRKNTVENLKRELESNGIETAKISDAGLKKLLAGATGRNQSTIKISELRAGRFTSAAVVPVVSVSGNTPKATPPSPRKRLPQKRRGR